MEVGSDVSAFWHILLDHQVATETQLEEAYEEHQRTGLAFEKVLANFGIITETEMLKLIAEALGAQYYDMGQVVVMENAVSCVPALVAQQYGVLPIYIERGILHVVAKDPMDYQMTDELGYVLGMDVRINVAHPDKIQDAIDRHYPEDDDAAATLKSIITDMEELAPEQDSSDEDEEEEDGADLADATPIVRFVNVILAQGIKDRASDIHFEPFAEEFRIRYRIDGTLYEMQPPPLHLAVPVISRVKVLSGLDISERRKPQDGRIELRLAGKRVDLRVSSLPTQYGESVVLRILDKSAVSLDLDVLGLPDDIKSSLREIIRKPNGIVLVTGPTGSGKTTTLYSCLKEINTIEDKVLTAEDPVEYDIEGLMQVPVQTAIGMTFAKALKAFLRQDPDRIMVGEIRDLETASISIEAALTGHLVLSTLHTNDAPSSVTRLTDMGVEPFLITSTMECVLAQRLVRRVCGGCKVGYDPTDDELDMLKITREDVGENKFYYGKGCELCNDIGYKGRKGLYEMFVLSKDVRELILERRPASDLIAKAREEGMRSLREAGVLSILSGETSVEEVLKYT